MLDGEGDCEELVCLFWVVFGYGAGMGDEIGTGNRTEEDGIGKRKETWELLNSVDRRREPSLDGVGGDDGSGGSEYTFQLAKKKSHSHFPPLSSSWNP